MENTNNSSQTSPEQATETSDWLSLMSKKLNLEVLILQNQFEALEPKKGAMEKIGSVLTKHLTWISTTIVLTIGIVKPFSDYIEAKKKSQIVSINNDILTIIFDNNTGISKSKLVELSIQPPDVLAPLLLSQLNAGKIDGNIVDTIYIRMYNINREISQKGPINIVMSFFFEADNKEILIDDLCEFAQEAFREKLADKKSDYNQFKAQLSILQTYIDIMTELKISSDSKVKRTLDILLTKCGLLNYESICNYVHQHIK